MVQVDVFWSYGIGAGFAIANAWQLERHRTEKKSVFDHPSFRDTLLFLSCIFAPSGVYLLWAFPSWETMHAGDRNMPAWLVMLFAITNITQGVLGFWVANRLMQQGRRYAAYLQWVLGYFAMLFVLVHGWDGTGYMRFFSPTKDDLAGWTWATAGRWVTSEVSLSLMAMGVVLLPVMLGSMGRMLKAGFRLNGEADGHQERLPAWLLGVSFLVTTLTLVLGLAVLASVAIRYLGVIAGPPAFAVAAYFITLRPGALLHRHFRWILYAEPLLGRVKRPVMATQS